jgi:hypothetical protein
VNVDRIILKVTDSKKKEALLQFLRQLNFVTVEDTKPVSSQKKDSLKELFGIWEGRSVDISTIRQAAWKS